MIGSLPLTFLALKGCCAPLARALAGERGDAAAGDRRLSVVMLAGLALCAYYGKDLLLIVALRGAMLGALIIHVLPAIIGLGVLEARAADPALSLERGALWGLLSYGLASIVLNTAVVLRCR